MTAASISSCAQTSSAAALESLVLSDLSLETTRDGLVIDARPHNRCTAVYRRATARLDACDRTMRCATAKKPIRDYWREYCITAVDHKAVFGIRGRFGGYLLLYFFRHGAHES